MSGHLRLFLIGYRGSGKTTVARHLATRLNWDWVDADDEVERRAGKSIAEIFADDGEQAFRDLESDVIAEIAQRTRWVIALGGGAVLREQNRQVIQHAGPVVWLTASVDSLAERMNADRSTASRRPNLTNSGGRTEIEKLLAQRTPIYRACATLEVDTENVPPADVADAILRQLPP